MVTAEPTEPPGYPEEFMCDTFYEEHLKGGKKIYTSRDSHLKFHYNTRSNKKEISFLHDILSDRATVVERHSVPKSLFNKTVNF